MTMSDIADAARGQSRHGGRASYPEMEAQPVQTPGSEEEMRIVARQLSFLQHQRTNSVWWSHNVTGPDTKRGAADIPRYSDRFRPVDQQNSTTLSDVNMEKILQKTLFPAGLWTTYIQGETKRLEKSLDKKRKHSDWQQDIDRLERNADGPGDLSDQAPSDEEEDLALDEYEDDEDDDYASNYFDNGEDDDIPEIGGGEAEADFE